MQTWRGSFGSPLLSSSLSLLMGVSVLAGCGNSASDDGPRTGGSTGTFFEGAMTKGNPPDATDDAIQANIITAGYGH